MAYMEDIIFMHDNLGLKNFLQSTHGGIDPFSYSRAGTTDYL